MKKFIAVTAIALLFTGCCTYTATDGTVSKSFANCLKTSQDKVCNAPADVLAMIDSVIQLAEIGVATFIPGSAPYLAAVQSFGTATNIKAGLCISLAQLNALIAFINSPDAQVAQTKMMAKAGPMKAKVIDPTPLVNWGK